MQTLACPKRIELLYVLYEVGEKTRDFLCHDNPLDSTCMGVDHLTMEKASAGN